MVVDAQQVGMNVFIEFKIIRESNPIKLAEEIDKLIAHGKKVYSWSKTVTPIEQATFCSLKVIPRSAEEKDRHKKIKELRDSGYSYDEISKELKIHTREIGFFLKRDFRKEWTLTDYILDYYKKDSSIYPKVDIIIDPDPVLVERFKKIGIHGNVLERL